MEEMCVLAKPLYLAGEFQRDVTVALAFIRALWRHGRGPHGASSVIEHGSQWAKPSREAVGPRLATLLHDLASEANTITSAHLIG
jgi:hypothetical protein